MPAAKLKYSFFLPFTVTASVIMLYFVADANYLLFHSIVELSTIAIAFALFLIAWNVKDRTDNFNLIYLGIAYFFVGIIDLFHTFSYKGMGIFNYDYYGSELWVAARYMESISLLVCFALSNKVKPILYEIVFSIYFIVTGLLLASIYYWRFFPVCHIGGNGQTEFKIISEYIICGIFAGSFFTLYHNRKQFDKSLMPLFYWTIGLSIAAEFCFSLYIHVHGLMNFIGHIFKLATFYLIYKAIIENGLRQPFNLIFKELKEKETLLDMTQTVGKIGGWEYNMLTDQVICTDEVFRLCELPLDYQPNVKDALSFYKENSSRKIKKTIRKLIESGGTEDMELEMHTAKDRKIWVRVTFAAKREKNKTVGLYGIIQDITEYKNMEKLREDMERITRHDLKNPLNSIYIAAQLLEEKKMTKEDYNKMTDIIKSSVYRLMDMINLSLSIYRIEEGVYKLTTAPFDLHSLLNRIINDQVPNIDFISIINREDHNKTAAFTVEGEANLIYSMLSNLLKNAIEASPQGKKVKIKLENRNDKCVIEIKNQGTVPKELKSKFFSKYASYGKKGGIGLGTYGAKLITELHHGRIFMKSSEKTGTVVTVELPHNQ